MGHAVRHLRDAADPFISNLKRRVYPTLELDYNKLLDMVSEMGYRLMKSGAEIYRVEESIQRLLQAYGAPRGEVFAIPNCLMVSLTSPDGRPVTQIRRMPTHGTDIYLLEKYNGLCRRLCRETPAFEEALEQMEAITRTHRVYSLPTQLAAHFLGCGMFSLFYGGTPADGLCGGLCGMVIGLCMALMTRLGANLFFRTIAGGAASALAAVALTRLGVGQNQDLIIIGALMALVPGIAKASDFELATMRYPVAKDAVNPGILVTPSVFLTISANSKHPDVAADFINYMLNDPEAISVLKDTRGIPANKTAKEQLVKEGVIDGKVSTMVAQALSGAGTAENGPSLNSEVLLLLKDYIQEVGYQQMPPEEAAAEFRSELEVLLETIKP